MSSEINSKNSYFNQNSNNNNNNNYQNNGLKFTYYKKKDNDNNHYKNNRSSNKNKSKTKKLKINSISELEFLYNDSQDKTTTTNKNIKLTKKNLNFSFKDKITNLSSINQNSTDVNYNNKISRQTKDKKKQNLYSHLSFNDFWQNVNKYQKEKEEKINNLKTELIKRQNQEIYQKPKISQKSISLALKKDRDSLYLKRPLSEEKYLDENFISFYKRNLQKNKEIKKEKYLKETKVKNKFDKFYEDNIRWKQNKEEINKKLRTENIKKYEDDIKTLTFRPILSENTLRIVKKMDRSKSMNLTQLNNNNLYNNENERELLEKLKIKLKPVLSELFNINNKKRPFINKKSNYLVNNTNNNLYKNKSKKLSKYNSYQILPKKNINNKIFYVKKEENKNDVNEFNKYHKSRKNKYEYYLLQKFKELNKSNKNNKKELYKLNIRQETAWNQEFVNNIIPKKKCGYIIEGLL